MKNIKKILLVIIFAVFLGVTSSFAAQTGKISVETANLRKEANEDSSILDQLSQGEEIEVIEKQDNWYKVEVEGITGYLREDLITVSEEASNETSEESENTNQENTAEENVVSEEQTGETEQTEEAQQQTTANEQNVENSAQSLEIGTKKYILNDTNLKLIPLITSENVVNLAKDTEVTVSEIMNDWVCVENASGEGWVRSNMLADAKTEPVVEETPEENPQEEPQEAPQNVLYVNAGTINLRKEPSSSSEILTNLTLNTEVIVISEDAGWTKVKVGEYEGYIASTLLSDTKQEETVTSRSSGIRQEEAVSSDTSSESAETSTVSNATNTNSSSAVATTGSAVVEKAKAYLGSKYVYGGTSPSGFDCSGFTYYIYKQFGITLNRTAAAQYSNGVPVARSDLQLGDLIMFGKSGINHVGIYIGGGKIVHAANPSRGVVTDTINSGYYNTNYVGARRVL